MVNNVVCLTCCQLEFQLGIAMLVGGVAIHPDSFVVQTTNIVIGCLADEWFTGIHSLACGGHHLIGALIVTLFDDKTCGISNIADPIEHRIFAPSVNRHIFARTFVPDGHGVRVATF